MGFLHDTSPFGINTVTRAKALWGHSYVNPVWHWWGPWPSRWCRSPSWRPRAAGGRTARWWRRASGGTALRCPGGRPGSAAGPPGSSASPPPWGSWSGFSNAETEEEMMMRELEPERERLGKRITRYLLTHWPLGECWSDEVGWPWWRSSDSSCQGVSVRDDIFCSLFSEWHCKHRHTHTHTHTHSHTHWRQDKRQSSYMFSLVSACVE